MASTVRKFGAQSGNLVHAPTQEGLLLTPALLSIFGIKKNKCKSNSNYCTNKF